MTDSSRGSNAAEVAALIRLQTVPKLGAATLYKLLAALSVAEISPARYIGLSAAEMADSVGETFRWVADALSVQDSTSALAWTEKLLAEGWRVVTHVQPEYPASVRLVLGDKCPPLLYVKGHIPLLHAPGIAFSGSRNVSERGLSAAAALAEQSATQGLTVISGHAKGVDQTAHHAALESGGATVFIPSEGALRFRLRADLRRLADEKPQAWVIATQYAPMDGWHVGNAMQRNRTLIGLSKALFIIEAGLDGGTWDASLEAERLRHPLYILHDPDPASGNAAILQRGKARSIITSGGIPQFPDLSDSPPDDTHHQLQLL